MANYTTTSNIGLPDWLQPQAAGYINRAQSVADTPYQPYGGQRVAGMTDWQQQGLQAQAQRGMSGSAVMNAANQALPGMFGGGGQASKNQYGMVTADGGAAAQNQYGPIGNNTASAAQNQYGPVSSSAGAAAQNPYSQVAPQTNAYAGANPFLQQNIDSATGDVTRAWNNVQKPQWDSAMGQSGSFGNSGVMLANQNAQSDMQRNLGNMASGMRMQDYTQQQQLGESAVNRNMQAQQFNLGMGEQYAGRQDNMRNQDQARSLQAQQFNSGMGEQYAGRQDSILNQLQSRNLQAQQFNLGMGEQYAGRQDSMRNQDQGRNMQAQQFNANMGENFAGRQDSMFNQGQGRAMNALGLAPAFAQNDYNDINAMRGAGGAYQAQNQAQLDSGYQQYVDAQNYPQKQLDVFGNALGKLNWGSQGSSSQPGPSAGAQVAGGAVTGAALYNLLFGGGKP